MVEIVLHPQQPLLRFAQGGNYSAFHESLYITAYVLSVNNYRSVYSRKVEGCLVDVMNTHTR